MVIEKVLDVLVVGAGFSGLYVLHTLRNLGFSVKVFEAGGNLGGTWYWNCYPGARTDTEYKIYQFSHDKIPSSFEWTERFPAGSEIQSYFNHIDKNENLSRDIQYNTRVSSAHFNQSRNQWLIKTEAGESVWANYLVLCTGFASRRYTPPFKGLKNFKGECYHSAVWPQDGVNLNGKRVAVIGTGATGVQLIQEIGPEVSHLTVYQRTPNLALPMQQFNFKNHEKWVTPTAQEYEQIFSRRIQTVSGHEYISYPKNAMDDSPEERRALYEELYRKGGFSFWIATYKDILSDKVANDTAYEFWCEKTRARINDPIKKDILAPKKAPHAFGTKRPCLEQSYYEVYNQNNVDIIDIRNSPIIEITENGIITENEGLTEVDVIALATGFDAVTGGILDINITNSEGETLNNKWKNGASTHLGISTAGFPNMFFLYGPQAPTALANGPTCIEIQGDWLSKLLKKMRDDGQARIQATKSAEDQWKQNVIEFWNSSLFKGTASSYQGSNIPGKPVEPLNYNGGIPSYIKALEDCSNNNYKGFILG